MTNLKIEAVLKATDEQIEEMIEANAFNPETEELEHFKVTISCDLNEVSMEEVLGVLRQLLLEDNFVSAQIIKETSHDQP